MIRTPIYSNLSAARVPTPEGAVASTEPAREAPRDNYLAKIVKYVPAEVLGPFVALAAAAAAASRELLIAVIIAGLVATPGYFYARSMGLPETDRPKLYFYVLSTIAFITWAIGSSGSVRTLVGIEAGGAEVILGLGALLIPLVDEVLTALTVPRQT